jgi:serine/threonine protein kinase
MSKSRKVLTEPKLIRNDSDKESLMKPQPSAGSPAEKKSPPKAFQEGNLTSRAPSEGGPPSLDLHFPVADQKVPPGSPPTSGVQRWQICHEELKFEYPALGKGAFGEVFKGTYRKSQVAIKVYDFQGQLALEEKTMVSKEAEVMEGLRSEYLVGFRGLCLDPRYCLVMEFCDGGTLRARLNQTSQTVTPIEQMRWAMQISYGLYQLHSVNILHRDLKGENILLDGRNHAKVADFGLSIVKSSSASHSRSSGGRGGAGTLPWMAPELHDKKSNSKATDVYSLGVVLWEIVSRKLPYAGLGGGQMISRTLLDKRDPLPNPCPEVFRLMILACCQLEASKRLTAEQVGEQFDGALRSVESVPKPLSNSSPNPPSPKALPYGPLIPPVDQKDLNQLLHYVAEGEQDKAEALIQKDKNLLLHPGTIKDLSGREFKQIKAFQYALWAMDWHMWTMIQEYLPQEAQAHQCQELETQDTAHGKHFSLESLTGALRTYVDNAETVWKYDQRAADHWCKKVGEEQKLLPAHVVNEYCRADRSFKPCPSPSRWKAKLPRTRELEVYDSSHAKWVKGSWFVAPSSNDGLGVNFAFYRYSLPAGGCAAKTPRGLLAVAGDLKALQSLWKTRTQQRELLRSQLLSVSSESQVLKSR